MKLFSLVLIFSAITALADDDKCFQISTKNDSWNKTPEHLCLSENEKDSSFQVKLVLGI